MLNFTVGPVMTDCEVLKVSAESSPYFRTPEFSKIMLENERMMLSLLNAPDDSRCVFLTTSGTGAMESCVINLLNNKDKILIVNGGSFGQRFVDLCSLHKLNYTEIKCEFGRQIKLSQLEAFKGQGYTALLINMDETSSGTLYDMNIISRFCKDERILLIVDAISSFIVDELDMSQLNAAAVITGSQKALAVHPGISVIALSPIAIERVIDNEEKCMYLSLKEALKNGERGQTPFTPAVTTLLEIHTRLEKIIDQGGIEAERNKIVEIVSDFRKRIKKFPFEFISEAPSNCVTSLKTKDNNAKTIVQIMKDEYNIWLCPNGGALADTVFRVGHIGAITLDDNSTLINAFEDMQQRGLL